MSKNITVNGATYDASYVSAPLADGSGNATFRESSELSLQSKSVTPTKAEQSVTSDPPYFGLSSLSVKAIPDTYVQPTSTNAGGELTAGSTIAAGTYFSGEATVPSGGGLAEGQTAVHGIPNGKILSTQIVLSENTSDSTLSATLTLPNSLSGELPDYLISVSNVHLALANTFSFKFTAKTGGEYSSAYGGLWRSNANAWSNLSSSAMAMDALVEGTMLTIRTGPKQGSLAYKWPAGTVTLYAIYTSDDAS